MMKAKEIILLVLLIAAGILLYQERTGKIGFDWRPGDFIFLDGEAFTYYESQVIEAPLPTSLRLLNAHGDVTIEAAETDRITLALEKKVWRHREPEAKAVADQLHPRVARDGDSVVIGTNRDEFKRRNFETNFRLTVPAAVAVDVENSYGTVKVRGVSAAVIANRHGEVDASAIAGVLKVNNSYEDVTVDGVRSLCEIHSAHSDVIARNIEGELRVDHQYGLARLQTVAQKVTFDGPHAEVIAEDVAGPVDIRNSYEKVTLRRVGPAKVTGHHSDVEAAEVNGNLEVSTSYATVTAGSVRGGLRVSGRSVGLSGASLTGGDIYVSTSYEPVEISGFSGKTTILVSHGQVTVTPLPLTGPIEVRCDYSPITFHWPAGGPYPVEARCRSGQIRWRLADLARVEEKDGMEEVRAFSDLKDKPGILLVTSYENIEVEKD
jgi:hypothetical protein